MRGEATDPHPVPLFPFIINYYNSGLFDPSPVLITENRIMVTEGEVGWGDGHATREERDDVPLLIKDRPRLGYICITHITCYADKGWGVLSQRSQDRDWIRIVKVSEESDLLNWQVFNMVVLFTHG